jgi:alkyl sulfatase BDS1-like metallo-beta-lactamase superfamily hydrolase
MARARTAWWPALAAAAALAALLAWSLQHSGRGAPLTAGAGAATPATLRANAATAAALASAPANPDATRGLVARPHGKVLAADGSTIWDYERFDFISGPAPATVNPSLWRHAALNNARGLFKVAEGIHQLRGFDLGNLTLIDGATGWIVVDPLTTEETAAAALAFARRHLGNRPVSAIIFTHSHVDHFGGALGVLSAAQRAGATLPVVAPEGFLDEATSENILVGPAMGRRAGYQFGSALPASVAGLVDAGLGKGVAAGHVGILAPTVTISKANESVTIDGVRIDFQNIPGSEAPAELAFYLPAQNAYCGAELLTQTLHNLYTLRGAKVRDALRWAGYIDQALVRYGTADVFFASHHWPVWGAPNIAAFMASQRDAYLYIHDQTVRMLNAGMPPQEIAEHLQLPPSLQAVFATRGYYGTVRHNAKAVYQHYLGWFDGNPANLDPLPRQQAALRYVALMGGVDKTVAAAGAAFDDGQFRWAAELLNHVVFAAPTHAGARLLLARSYEQLAYVAESASWRNFYLTGAQELRSGKTANGPDPARALGLLAQAPVERFLDAMAASLNGPRAEGVAIKLNLLFSDGGQSHVLWIENAVLHHRAGPPAPDANASITLTRALFLKLLTGGAGARETLLGDALRIDGSRIALLRFFSLLDKPPRSFPIVTP